MEYKTRFHPHVIVGYSIYKIEASAQFFAFAARLLNAGEGDPSRPPYYQAIKVKFRQSKFLIPVANGSTGAIQV